MKNSIFISYRRSGTSWSTRALHDRLGAQFGKDHVFMDVSDIDYGSDFADRIEREIGRCDAVLVVIGPHWISATDAAGNRRLNDPADYVRLEVGMGLKRRIPVIPVLVDGASMPREAELPDDLKSLSRCNAIELRHAHFDSDAKVLLDSLQQTLDPAGRALSIDGLVKAMVTRNGLFGLLGLLLVALFGAMLLNVGGEDDPEGEVAARDKGLAIGAGATVGDVTIHHGSDPALVKLVEGTVSSLVDQLKKKDQQIQLRDEQTQHLSSAVAALARERDQPNAPPGLQQALENLSSGDTEAAKAIFRQLLDQKAAEARLASRVAADAAKHLGALAALTSEEEAAKAYGRAVELAPDDAEARDLWAAIQDQPGQFRLQAALAEGGGPIEACISIYHPELDLDGKRKRVTYDCGKKVLRFNLVAGSYVVVATAGNASVTREFELTPGGLIDKTISLGAGQLRLQAALVEGGDPVEACISVYRPQQNLDGKRTRLTYDCGKKAARFTLGAGRYFVRATAGNASTTGEFEVTAGGLVNETMNLEAGQLRLLAALAAGGEPVEACISVYYPQQDLDGKRQRVTYDCGKKAARFTLNAGRYFVRATAGNASTTGEFEVTAGGLVNETMNLEAGQLRLQAALAVAGEPVEACISVYHPQQNLDGKRTRLTYDCGKKAARFTLGAGRYFVRATAGNASTTGEFEVTAGGLVNETMNLEAGQLRLQAALATGGEPVEACISVYQPEQDLDGKRKRLTYDCGKKPALFTVNTGRYFVLASAGGASVSEELDVAPGQLVDRRMLLQ